MSWLAFFPEWLPSTYFSPHVRFMVDIPLFGLGSANFALGTLSLFTLGQSKVTPATKFELNFATIIGLSIGSFVFGVFLLLWDTICLMEDVWEMLGMEEKKEIELDDGLEPPNSPQSPTAPTPLCPLKISAIQSISVEPIAAEKKLLKLTMSRIDTIQSIPIPIRKELGKLTMSPIFSKQSMPIPISLSSKGIQTAQPTMRTADASTQINVSYRIAGTISSSEKYGPALLWGILKV